jgi:hypothetical protein
LDFADDGVGREAAGFAADKGDHTVRAAKVAAVLDLQDGACMMGFAALDGGGEEFGVVEDSAGEDVGEMGRFDGMRKAAKRGHGMPCPYEGMKWDGRA